MLVLVPAADSHGVGRPGGLEGQARTGLDDHAGGQHSSLGEELGLECLAQEPLQRAHLLRRQRCRDLDAGAYTRPHFGST